MATMHPKVFLKNKIISASDANLSIASSAVLYGLSVYTVFAVHIDGDLKLAFRLPDHFKRLVNSCKIVGIDTFQLSWDYSKFLKTLTELLVANKSSIHKDIYVRATVHVDAEIAGTRSRGLSTSLSMFIYDASSILKPNGARLMTSHWRRVPDVSIPARAKVNGAYVNSVLAKQEALDSGYDDCIFLDTHGHVCELSAANIFLVSRGVLITPGVENDVLEGINRDTVILIAKSLGIDVIERNVDRTELYIADEIFACGTSANVASVIEIDGRIIDNGKIGPVTKKIQKIHTDIRSGANKDFANLTIEI